MDPKYVNTDDKYYYNPPTKFDTPDQDPNSVRALITCLVIYGLIVSCTVLALGVVVFGF